MQLIRLAILTVATLAGAVRALDPVDPNYTWTYKSVYPPGGFNPKHDKIVPRAAQADPKKGKHALINKDGKFDEWAQFFYQVSTDPKQFERWWLGYFQDRECWTPAESPVFKGFQPGNQGHRQFAGVGSFITAVQKDPDIDAAIKKKVGSDEWKSGVEEVIRKTIDEHGVLAYRMPDGQVHQGNMAQTFHFIRTKYGAMRLRVQNIYTLEKSQELIAALLTEPWMICEEDKWLAPPSDKYLEDLGPQKLGEAGDIRMVKDGKILYSGGLFIGWCDKPALHGTWDGLAIINSLFKYYPVTDPANPKSIFYKWHQLPEAKRQIGTRMIKLCADRLWLDWKERKKPIWTWMSKDLPSHDSARPSDAAWMPAYDGYGENQIGWSKACWEELWGEPSRNTTDGCQALLAIANGKVLEKLTLPVGQQVVGNYSFSADEQGLALDTDGKKLADPKYAEFIKQMYGLSVEQARERIQRYRSTLNLPPGQLAAPASDEPKLDPTKIGKGKPNE